MLYRESIFLTGFPGFIAGRLVARLARSETQFYLLVQPQFVEQAIEDVEAIAEETGVPLESFVIVEGDITKPDLGIEPDDRGRIPVNAHYQTSQPHIYAVGDVVGFPSLASTSMEQGRLAACHAFGIEAKSVPGLFPYGIYTIPEISMVGRTEEELTDAGIPYEVGKAHYREIARGQITGDNTGLLKLIFHLETRQLLGVHIIGEGATELIHIGQAVLTYGGRIDYFIHTVFNYPTLAECYKTAAFDGINRM